MISPKDFTRIMALPAVLRHDVLEYLGATPVAETEVDDLLRRLSAEGARPEAQAASAAA